MSSAELRDLLDNGGHLEPLSVEQYHRIIATGILPEGDSLELLDGMLVRKDRAAAGEDIMTVGSRHAWAVQNLGRVLAGLESGGCHLRTQQPITILPLNEPEPDGAVALGTIDDYRDAHPGPDRVLCVIEVADSSLQHDRSTKLRIYASAGVRQYLILNLVEGVVELHEQPDPAAGTYRLSQTLSPLNTISLRLAGDAFMDVAVRELLP
jgi:Uma2 family endonuclease